MAALRESLAKDLFALANTPAEKPKKKRPFDPGGPELIDHF